MGFGQSGGNIRGERHAETFDCGIQKLVFVSDRRLIKGETDQDHDGTCQKQRYQYFRQSRKPDVFHRGLPLCDNHVDTDYFITIIVQAAGATQNRIPANVKFAALFFQDQDDFVVPYEVFPVPFPWRYRFADKHKPDPSKHFQQQSRRKETYAYPGGICATIR